MRFSRTDPAHWCPFGIDIKIVPTIRMVLRAVGLRLRVLSSALGIHIMDIVCRGTQEQVVRVTAWWVVTMVKDPEPIWYRTVGIFPHQAMGL
jgi:hypothetical protein